MIKRIESPDNPKIRLIRKLKTRKGRNAEGRFVIEGANLIREAADFRSDIDFVMISGSGVRDPGLADILSGSGIRIFEVPDGLFRTLTDAENGIDALAAVRMPDRTLPDPSCIDMDSNILVLDRIQDPGNMGTMIRTAVAAGYSMIICARGTADVYSPKVLRSTAGMIFRMPVCYADNSEDLMDFLRSSGLRITVTTPDGGVPYYHEDLRSGIALVIGNEGAGISDELIEMADLRVTIPMKGSIESLNAAVSAALLMYEAVRISG